jgi:hypothetical protein
MYVFTSVAQEPERTRLYDKMVAMMPAFGEYRQKAKRKIPVIVLTSELRIKTTHLRERGRG